MMKKYTVIAIFTNGTYMQTQKMAYDRAGAIGQAIDSFYTDDRTSVISITVAEEIEMEER